MEITPIDNRLKFTTPPYQYQISAVDTAISMLRTDGYFALLGEVGTGKTKIAIDVIQNMSAFLHHVVIACPKSLVSTWEKELKKHSDFPPHKIHRWDRMKRPVNVGLSRQSTNSMLLSSGYIFIVNIEAFQIKNILLNKIMESLIKEPAAIFLDESVKIQTPGAVRTKALIKWSNSFSYRAIMTGTDISSGPQALYSQWKFLQNGFWNRHGYANYASFKMAFTIMKKVYIQTGMTIETPKRMDEMTAVEQAMQRTKLKMLNEIIAPHAIRILRKDCLDLPPQINVEVPITLTKDERRVYNDMLRASIAMVEQTTVEAVTAIAMFTRLRQITCGHIDGQAIMKTPAKLAWLLDDIEDHNENCIIVAYFHKDIENIMEALQSAGIDARSYYGANKPTDNEENKGLFEDGKLRVLVAGHDMIAQGHNLQEYCSLMYVYSVSLNSEVNMQYKGRIDRNGQRKNPVFKYLLAENTIDERIHALIEGKADVQKMFSEMGRSELLNMLKNDVNTVDNSDE